MFIRKDIGRSPPPGKNNLQIISSLLQFAKYWFWTGTERA